DRLSGHHFVVLLPLAYIALGAGLSDLDRGKAWHRIPALLMWVVVASINLAALEWTNSELLQTHGRGLFSDAIDRLAADAQAQESLAERQFFYFPDWGLFMPFHFLTNGKIGHATQMDAVALRRVLCRGDKLRVAYVNGDVDARSRELQAQI